MNARLLCPLVIYLILAASLPAQVPQLINYQGRVIQGGTNFNGAGSFKFALVNAAGNVTFWSNDGSSVAGSQPTAAVALTVVNGLYSVLLGDATIPNMTVVPVTVFNNSDVRLRVWFNGGPGFQQLSPDQRIAAVGYAMMAANVQDGSITSAKIAPGAVGTTQLAANSVTSVQLGDNVALGNPTNAYGRLDIYRAGASNTAAISLVGIDNRVSTYGDDGQEQVRLWGPSWGEVLLFDSTVNNNQVVNLSANGSGGGRLLLYATNGNNTLDIRAELSTGSGAGWMTLRDGNRENISFAARNGVTGRGGLIDVKNTNSANTLRLFGDTGAGLSAVELHNSSNRVVSLAGNSWGGWLETQDETGARTALIGSSALAGGFCELNNSAGNVGLRLDGDDGGGGLIQLRNAAGVVTISIDGDFSGDGRVTTQELQITGGSDLSEQFDIKPIHDEITPGMIVCIDPENPGQLLPSAKSYDRTVAGVISGAGGVKPGMLMGQKGTKADGKHPVALTGRVYCWMDASHGAIKPGDLITTSDTPGHGMKVTDPAKANGAIIGKAMTGLSSGRGLVLLLVSLQ